MVASLVFVDAVASSSSSDFNISTSKGNRGVGDGKSLSRRTV